MPPTAALDIVVVDDDELCLYLFRRALERLGHRVRTFPDATVALAGLVAPDRAAPDVVFVDLHMPTLSGVELLARRSASSDAAGTTRLFVCSAVRPTAAELAGIEAVGARTVVKDVLRGAAGFERLLATA